jgi:folate-binding protein YgfZ
MPQGFWAPLENRCVIRITGTDAKEFLQGLITNDMDEVKSDRWLYAGLLTPQGKILFDFFILPDDDGYLIDCAAIRKDALLQRLALYRLRAAVEIAPAAELSVAAVWPAGDGVPAEIGGADILSAPDPRTPAAGLRCLGLPDDLAAAANRHDLTQATAGDYDRLRLELGLPEALDIGEGEHFIHDSNFDRLKGLSFSKGCYVGQEVVSRVEHRGSARKRMMPVTFEGTNPAFGAAIKAGDRHLGEILTGRDGLALALIRLDHLAKAQQAGETLEAGGVIVEPAPPPWLDLAAERQADA